MNTITLTPEIYNGVKAFADEKNVSVDEYVISLINAVLPKRVLKKKKYKMKKTEELSPVLQNILNMPKIGSLDDDVNGDKAREEYYKEKIGL